MTPGTPLWDTNAALLVPLTDTFTLVLSAPKLVVPCAMRHWKAVVPFRVGFTLKLKVRRRRTVVCSDDPYLYDSHLNTL
jgi:hypothetical protein